jgi:hypothetical protein
MMIVSIPWWLALMVLPLIATMRITIVAIGLTTRALAALVRWAQRSWQLRQQ